MTDFIIKKLPYDLSSHAGLALIGKYFKRININSLIDPVFPVRSGVANSAIVKSYLALLCLGKNDFDAIENFRGNAFFMRALSLASVPSSPTLRQRLDTHAASWFDLAAQLNHQLLASTVNGKPIDFGALACGYTPVDLDTFAMDNSSTKKELVGRTYAGVDGYCPFAVYLGSLGYCLELALRPGVQHSASESEYNFERALPMAASLVAGSMLVRADSGFDSLKLYQAITAQANALEREIAFIIKWNPRRAPVEAIAGVKVADAGTQWVIHRPGKRECVWQEALQLADMGIGPHRFSSACCMQLLLVAYQPYFGLLQNARDKCVVALNALGHVCGRVQRGVDLAPQRGGGRFQGTKHVCVSQVGADDHHVNIAMCGVLLLGHRAINEGRINLRRQW